MSKGQRALMWLGQAVTAADNAALGRVVALLDGVRNRGEADALLDRARDRLRQLRPQRPLGFARLLFLPLDGAIVPPSRWRRGEGQVPRSALPVLSELVHAALGPEAESIAAACEGKTVGDAEAVERVGARLWTAAARGLPAVAPPEWEESGLAAADYPEIAALCRPVWAAGPALRAAAAGERTAAAAALAALAEAGPAPFSAGLATLVEAAPLPGALLRAAAGVDARFRAVVVRRAEAALDNAAPQLDRLDAGAAAATAAALAVRLDDLEGCGLLDQAGRKRLHAQRRAAEEACRERFLAGAERQIIEPLSALSALSALAAAPEAADAAVVEVETAARGLARLESAGRRLGGGAYDRARAAIVESLALLAARAKHPEGLRPMDLARVAEILAGPDEAAAVLSRAQAAEAQPPAGTPAGSPLPAR